MCACELLFASKNMSLYKHSVFFCSHLCIFLSRCFVDGWYKGWKISIGKDDILGDDYEVGEARILFLATTVWNICVADTLVTAVHSFQATICQI